MVPVSAASLYCPLHSPHYPLTVSSPSSSSGEEPRRAWLNQPHRQNRCSGPAVGKPPPSLHAYQLLPLALPAARGQGWSRTAAEPWHQARVRPRLMHATAVAKGADLHPSLMNRPAKGATRTLDRLALTQQTGPYKGKRRTRRYTCAREHACEETCS